MSQAQKLENYIGRIVRLNQQAFREIAQRAKRQGRAPENCFLVADVSRELRKLICYGENFRVAVSISEVALI